MTAIEQTLDKIDSELKAFRQNNRPDDYIRLLDELDEKLEEWLEEAER